MIAVVFRSALNQIRWRVPRYTDPVQAIRDFFRADSINHLLSRAQSASESSIPTTCQLWVRSDRNKALRLSGRCRSMESIGCIVDFNGITIRFSERRHRILPLEDGDHRRFVATVVYPLFGLEVGMFCGVVEGLERMAFGSSLVSSIRPVQQI